MDIIAIFRGDRLVPGSDARHRPGGTWISLLNSSFFLHAVLFCQSPSGPSTLESPYRLIRLKIRLFIPVSRPESKNGPGPYPIPRATRNTFIYHNIVQDVAPGEISKDHCLGESTAHVGRRTHLQWMSLALFFSFLYHTRSTFETPNSYPEHKTFSITF